MRYESSPNPAWNRTQHPVTRSLLIGRIPETWFPRAAQQLLPRIAKYKTAKIGAAKFTHFPQSAKIYVRRNKWLYSIHICTGWAQRNWAPVCVFRQLLAMCCCDPFANLKYPRCHYSTHLCKSLENTLFFNIYFNNSLCVAVILVII